MYGHRPENAAECLGGKKRLIYSLCHVGVCAALLDVLAFLRAAF